MTRPCAGPCKMGHLKFFSATIHMAYRSRSRSRRRSPYRARRSPFKSRRRTRRSPGRRARSPVRRYASKVSGASPRAVESAANEAVANADPRDVEHAAGNGTPAQVEKARVKLANRAAKLLPYAKYVGAATAGGLASFAGTRLWDQGSKPGGFLRAKHSYKNGKWTGTASPTTAPSIFARRPLGYLESTTYDKDDKKYPFDHRSLPVGTKPTFFQRLGRY